MHVIDLKEQKYKSSSFSISTETFLEISLCKASSLLLQTALDN